MDDEGKRGKGGKRPGYLMPNFRAIRLELGLTQDECATRIGVSRWTIIQWERYRTGVSRQRLQEITTALGITTEDLFGTTLQPKAEPWRRPVPPTEPPPSWTVGSPGPRGIPLPGLRAVRYRLGLSAIEFANRVGLSLGTIARIERGKGGAYKKTIQQIVDHLGIDPSELLEPDADPPASPGQLGTHTFA